jgi:hypothetical protein
MFAILVVTAAAAAAPKGSWSADHTTMLREWRCTPERLAYHMCEANTGGANSDGTAMATKSNEEVAETAKLGHHPCMRFCDNT